jgi:hypothetical protein
MKISPRAFLKAYLIMAGSSFLFGVVTTAAGLIVSHVFPQALNWVHL